MNRTEFNKIMKFAEQQKLKSKYKPVKEKPKIPKVKVIDEITKAKLKYIKSKEKRRNFRTTMKYNIQIQTINEYFQYE